MPCGVTRVELCGSLESVLGRLDVSTSPPDRSREEVGDAGFALFVLPERARFLPALGVRALKARLYRIGNPVTASETTRTFSIAEPYVPLRVYIYEEKGATVLLTYDQPSSVLAAKEVAKTGRTLKEKLASLRGQATTSTSA
jgi:uncharacterized protein (DUF302 family)